MVTLIGPACRGTAIELDSKSNIGPQDKNSKEILSSQRAQRPWPASQSSSFSSSGSRSAARGPNFHTKGLPTKHATKPWYDVSPDLRQLLGSTGGDLKANLSNFFSGAGAGGPAPDRDPAPRRRAECGGSPVRQPLQPRPATRAPQDPADSEAFKRNERQHARTGLCGKSAGDVFSSPRPAPEELPAPLVRAGCSLSTPTDSDAADSGKWTRVRKLTSPLAGLSIEQLQRALAVGVLVTQEPPPRGARAGSAHSLNSPAGSFQARGAESEPGDVNLWTNPETSTYGAESSGARRFLQDRKW